MTTIKQVAANRANAKKSTGPRTREGKAKSSLNALKHGLLAEAAVLPDEDAAAFSSFADALIAELRPEGALEELLAGQIVNLAWRLRRASLVETGVFVREKALADEKWFREQRSLYEEASDPQTPLEAVLAQANVLPDDSALRIIDPDKWAEMHRGEHTAARAARSDLARLGAAFATDAAGPNAFSKLERYETALSRRLTRALTDLKSQQSARADRPADRAEPKNAPEDRSASPQIQPIPEKGENA